MSIETLHRLAAAALMAGGLMLGYAYISHPAEATPEVLASPSWITIHALFLGSIGAGLLGATGLYLRNATQTGLLGLAGFLSVFAGMMLIAGLDYYEVLIAPRLAAEFPEVIARYGAGDAMGAVAVVFPLSGLLTVAGFAILGYVTLRRGALPRLPLLALIVTSIAFGIGLSPVASIAVARVTAGLFGLALIWVGASYWRGMDSA
jgi:hypothetical protein